MGHDKALIQVGAQSLIARTCRLAQSVAQEVRIISPWPERYRALVPASVLLQQELPLTDTTTTHHGPVVALTQALSSLPAEPDSWVLVLACDLPNLSVELLQDWLATLPVLDHHTVVALPHQLKRWEPLCGFYRHSCQVALETYINRGGRSFQGWLADQRVYPLPLADARLLVNLNTPADLAQWQQAWR
jgi:molybdopterin-guanine dinucleotide biosynthesis protein A